MTTWITWTLQPDTQGSRQPQTQEIRHYKNQPLAARPSEDQAWRWQQLLSCLDCGGPQQHQLGREAS